MTQHRRGQHILERLRNSNSTSENAVLGDRCDLSAMQKILLASQDVHHSHAVNNIAYCWDLEGPLDHAALEASLGQLAQRHDALRMSIVHENGKAKTKFTQDLEPQLNRETVFGKGDEDRRQNTNRMIEMRSRTDLTALEQRLWEAWLFKIDDSNHVLLIVMHHLICDDWSWHVLERDLFAIYKAKSQQVKTELPGSGSFLSYLQHLPRQSAAQPEPGGQELDWPTTLQGEGRPNELGVGFVQSTLLPDEFDALRSAARLYNSTPFAICAAAYQFLLSVYCDQNEISISTPLSDRSGTGANNSIGLFIRDIRIETSISNHSSFSDLLENFQNKFRAEQTRTDSGLHPGRVSIAYYNAPNQTIDTGKLNISKRRPPRQLGAMHLHLSITPTSKGLSITLEGQNQFFDHEQLEKLRECYIRILRQVSANPAILLSDISLLPEDALKAQAKLAFNELPLPQETDIVSYFAKIAQQHASVPALETTETVLSYRELDVETNALARWLFEQGLEQGDRLMVCAPRGVEVFKIWLAALKAGLVVVPAEHELPRPRLLDILQQSDSKAVFCARGDAKVQDLDTVNVLTVPDRELLAQFSGDTLQTALPRPQDDAFLMFSSGTTGKPKSIPTSHIGIVRLTHGSSVLPVQQGDRVIQLASPGFDASFIEVWGAWLTGATLVLCEKPIFAEGGLAAEFQTLKPTAAFITTSLFNMIVDSNAAILGSLKYLATGGEAASVSHFKKALHVHPRLQLSNVYGPTENAALSTYHHFKPEDDHGIPIGQPLPNNVAIVLSDILRPIPDGFAGELLVGGPGLSRGYESHPEESRQKFIHIEARAIGIDREGTIPMYRTGDRVRRNRNGDLEFLGRRDTQFKLHGHRIEPTEIETALMQHPGIGRAVVQPDRREADGPIVGIVAYCEPAKGEQIAEKDLRTFMSERLPRPVLPTRYVQIDAIPITPNGKADLKSLKQIKQDGKVDVSHPAAPSDRLLAIWQKHLGLEQVPEDLDFYALGGTSLSLVQMILEVEETFEIEIDHSSFSREPKLYRLRYMVAFAPSNKTTKTKHLRVLKQGDCNKTPIILIPAAAGSAAWALELLPLLTAKNPIYALSFSLLESNGKDAELFETLLTSLLNDIEANFEGKQVILAGFSFGGTLAYHLAARARQRSIPIKEVINIDGGCPVSWIALGTANEQDTQSIFEKQFKLHPVAPIDIPFHLIKSTRAFPFCKDDPGEGWAGLVENDLLEYEFDTHHVLLIRPHAAGAVAQCINEILNGTAKPDRVRQGRISPKDVEALNEVKRLSLANMMPEATHRLESAIEDAGSPKDWMILGLIRFYQRTNSTKQLLRLKKELPLDGLSPQQLRAMLASSGKQRRELMSQCYLASGAKQSGAIPLVALHLRSGNFEDADKIIKRLESSPAFVIEAAMAKALSERVRGEKGRAQNHLMDVLSRLDATPSHFSWYAKFLAQNGELETALEVLDLGQPRFANNMNAARLSVEANYCSPPKRERRSSGKQRTSLSPFTIRDRGAHFVSRVRTHVSRSLAKWAQSE